jgi:hypothetical protein
MLLKNLFKHQLIKTAGIFMKKKRITYLLFNVKSVQLILFAAFFTAIMIYSSRANALTQPDTTPIPASTGCNAGHPSGLAAIFAGSCLQSGVSNIGAWCLTDPCDAGQNGTCETTLWHSGNDNTCIP